MPVFVVKGRKSYTWLWRTTPHTSNDEQAGAAWRPNFEAFVEEEAKTNRLVALACQILDDWLGCAKQTRPARERVRYRAAARNAPSPGSPITPSRSGR